MFFYRGLGEALTLIPGTGTAWGAPFGVDRLRQVWELVGLGPALRDEAAKRSARSAGRVGAAARYVALAAARSAAPREVPRHPAPAPLLAWRRRLHLLQPQRDLLWLLQDDAESWWSAACWLGLGPPAHLDPALPTGYTEHDSALRWRLIDLSVTPEDSPPPPPRAFRLAEAAQAQRSERLQRRQAMCARYGLGAALARVTAYLGGTAAEAPDLEELSGPALLDLQRDLLAARGASEPAPAPIIESAPPLAFSSRWEAIEL